MVQQNDNVGKADELGRKKRRNAQEFAVHEGARERGAKYDEQMKSASRAR